MRPEILFPLFAPLTALPGVGPRLAGLMERVAGPRVVDLLWHLPTGVVDRRMIPSIAAAETGSVATLRVHIDEHDPARSARAPYRVWCSDPSGTLALTFFHAQGDYLLKRLPPGTERIVSGRIEIYGDIRQIAHPDYIATKETEIPAIEPVYPLTTGLTSRPLHKAITESLKRMPRLPEWIEPHFFAARQWMSWTEAVATAHAPQGADGISPLHSARQRLAYDELLANQLALAVVRNRNKRRKGRAIIGDGRLSDRILQTLPFTLTPSQQQVRAEITADMASPARMLRLLQGDVGSGKTIVALLALATAVEAGGQGALVAPTEILARQHLKTIQSLSAGTGLRIALLTGRDRGKARQATMDRLANGEIDILIGTHALFEESVAFADLALAVIDEQHRFGVHQRLQLAAKGHAVDMLIMTATPIPRSLTLTAYGDIDVSRLTDRPPGRKPVKTVVLPVSRSDEVVQAVRRAIDSGVKVYWVCPLVGESETVDLAAAEARHRALQQLFGDRVGLVHGRMKGVERDKVMAAFAGDGLDILVATTVIEVGVDVPEAAVMVIEHAERFGLAQLHQLRGRVGRGSRESSCLLLYGSPLGDTARRRLAVLRETDDGFRIAEEDLELRGSGELLGTRQSGFQTFRLADPAVHGELLLAARDDARLIMDRDPHLTGERGHALRILLYLFERDAAVRYLLSG